MKKLVHPNIVQLVEVIDAPRDRSLYMVLEYVERGAVMRCVEPGMGRYECPLTGDMLIPRSFFLERSSVCPVSFFLLVPGEGCFRTAFESRLRFVHSSYSLSPPLSALNSR